MEKITVDTILDFLKAAVESKMPIAREVWLDASFKLNLLLGDEIHELETLRQSVAKEKFAILTKQEKKNVAAVDLEIETLDTYRELREKESKVERVKEFIRISKRNADNY